MKKILSIVLSLSLVFTLVVPASAAGLTGSDSLQIENFDETMFLDFGEECYSVRIVGTSDNFSVYTVDSNGVEDYAHTIVNDNTATIMTDTESIVVDVPERTPQIQPMATSYTEKGTIVYNRPTGFNTTVSIDFLYRMTDSGEGVVDLNQAEGEALTVLISVFSVAFGFVPANAFISGLIGVVFTVSGGLVSLIEDVVYAEWEHYACVAREDGVLSSTVYTGTAYFVQNEDGEQIRTHYDNITPYTWTDANTAIQFFTAFHSAAIYNGVMYYDWA